MERKIKNSFFLVLLFVVVLSNNLNAQVTIGSGYPPDENALLDLRENADNSSSKGFLLPRVSLISLTQPDPMVAFVEGMVVYNIRFGDDGLSPGFYYCDAYRWVRLEPTEAVVIPSEPWIDAQTGQGAVANARSIYQGGQVAIGKESGAEASAQLEIDASDRGILIPRLDKRQRDDIANPAQSLLIWNTDENCFNFWKGGKWRSMCGDTGESEIRITPVDCAAATVEGSYKVGVATTNGNYIQLTLQVIEPGTYIIEGQTNKGFFFQRSGSFSSIGTYTIQIPSIGTPNEAGSWSFPLTLNGNLFDPSCSKLVVVDPADVQFTFDPSYCGTNTYSDQLVRGEASTDKTTKIRVNVVNPGLFNFSTNTVNGVQYTANNVNLTTGSHEVILYANGNAPTAAGSNVAFTVTGTGLNGASCQVLVNILENDATLTANCGAAIVNGVYKLEVETTAANYIDIPVNFTSLGTWHGTATSLDAAFTFEGSGVVNATGAHTIRLYASGTPAVAGPKTFNIDINGVQCSVVVNVVMPTKKILVLGGASGAVRSALVNAANFGPTGKSKVENIEIIEGGNPYATPATLINLINDNNIEVIIAGWYFDCTDAVANVIADFVKNKKGFFFQTEGQDQQPYLKRILDKAYGLNVTFTEDEFPIYSAKLPNTDNPYFNGVFGDIRGKYVRSDDFPSWIGITPASETGALASLLQLPVNGAYPARNTFLYAPGFFMIPDWGMVNYDTATYGTASPIGYNPTAFNGYAGWLGSSYGISNIPAGQIGTWILFGNVMDHAFKYVHENINKTYQVSTNY